jgi:predicted transcriptional regulator YdeE
VPSIEHIGAAYGHIYSEWAKANPGLEPDHSRPSIERYPNPWTPGMALDIFVPIKKKAGE